MIQYTTIVVNISDLQKLDIRLGTIKDVEAVDGSEKLYKETVDFGDEIGERQILSGIQKYFTPDQLIGKQALFIVNLEPREMMGLVSEGMLLATDNEDGPVLLVPEKPVPNGAQIK